MQKDLLLLSTTITKTMCDVLENIEVNIENIIKVFNKQEVKKLNKKDYRKIYQFNKAFLTTLALNRKISFYDICGVNDMVECNLHDTYGKFTKSLRVVNSFDDNFIFIPPHKPETKKQEFDLFINKLENESSIETRITLILEFFLKEIVEQWFGDGNKRTALITCNKLLLDYCSQKEVTLLLKFDKEEFNTFLSLYYLEFYKLEIPPKYKLPIINVSYKNDFIEFLKINIYRNKDLNLKKDFLDQQVDLISLDSHLSDYELEKLALLKKETKSQIETRKLKEKLYQNFANRNKAKIVDDNNDKNNKS